MMLHCWVNIAPAGAPGMGDDPGVQVMLCADTREVLIGRVQELCESIGAHIDTVEPLSLLCNEERRLFDTNDNYSDDPSGLVVRTYPCSRVGGNLDVDPVEPRAE